MLVLRRKAGEAIVLNGTITIHVLAVEGERVKLGISAPPEVVIVRSELLEGQQPGQAPTGPEQQGPSEGPRREPPRPYRSREEPRGPSSYNGSARYTPRRRPYSEDEPAAPIGNGTDRYR